MISVITDIEASLSEHPVSFIIINLFKISTLLFIIKKINFTGLSTILKRNKLYLNKKFIL